MSRSRGAEVLSVEREYQPKITTWGVYERPRDISAAFGGGRNLKPSDSVMTREEQATYDAALREKLAALRSSSELVGSVEDVAQCEALTTQGAVEWEGSGSLGCALSVATPHRLCTLFEGHSCRAKGTDAACACRAGAAEAGRTQSGAGDVRGGCGAAIAQDGGRRPRTAPESDHSRLARPPPGGALAVSPAHWSPIVLHLQNGACWCLR